MACIYNALQYLVVYLCIVAEANATAFFLDGSSMSNIQVSHANAMLCACVQLAHFAITHSDRHHRMCCVEAVHHVLMQCTTAHLARCAPETMCKACHSLQSVTDCCNKASGLILLGQQLP